MANDNSWANKPHFPKPTAQVEPYVEALGFEDALKFLEAFGGTEAVISKNPREGSEVVELIGYAKARALAAISDRLQKRVPVAKKWRAKAYSAQGLKNVEIARRLGVTDVTVRTYLSGTSKRPPPNQLSLF